MRPLTDEIPKPLLNVGSQPLIAYHLQALAEAGIREVVINLSWLGERIRSAIGDGGAFGLSVAYSDEGSEALETGGGIFRALPLLGTEPFIVVNGDVWCEYEFASLTLSDGDLAQLVLVDNPQHHPGGDFHLSDNRVCAKGEPRLTFSGIGLYRPQLFAGCEAGAFPLAPLLRQAMTDGRIGGEYFRGAWCDVGTPDRLRQLDTRLRQARH